MLTRCRVKEPCSLLPSGSGSRLGTGRISLWVSKTAVDLAGSVAVFAGLTAFFLSLAFVDEIAEAAPILDQDAKKNVVIYCEINADGNTTCSVSRGEISACAERDSDNIERSFRQIEYLSEPRGCTLGVGYWREHAEGGSRPYDDIWDRLGSRGGETVFFDRTRTYLDVLSNKELDTAYDRLAQVFVATELNRLNRAILPPDAEAAYEQASALLIRGKPGDDAAQEAEFDRLAQILAGYVDGGIGPGRCAPATEFLDTADIGKSIAGLVSQDAGTIRNILPKPGGFIGDGEGVVVIQPNSDEVSFDVADEDFIVDGVRTGQFTQSLNNCVTAEAGEEFTLASGENPEPPKTIGDVQRADARGLQIMIALNNEAPDAEAAAPAAGGPAPTAPPPAPPAAAGAPAPAQDGGLAFPSETLPATESAGGGGIGSVIVPNVIGLTENEARSAFSDVGLVVGSVVFVKLEDPGGGWRPTLIASAYAHDPVVIRQDPVAGTSVTTGASMDITLETVAEDVPEPPSLLVFFAALLIVGYFLWRRSRRTDETV